MSMSNTTFNWTQESNNLTNVDVTIIITTLRITMMGLVLTFNLIAVVTNILVVATISASIKQWKYSMGTLMLTLALCDTVLNAIDFTLILGSSYFNPLFDIVLRYMLSSLETWSKFFMLAFSVNRYALVCKPFTHHRITSRKSTVTQLITLAVIAFTINIPMFFNRRMTERIFSIYELIGLIMVYYIPLIITFVLTVLVICKPFTHHRITSRKSTVTQLITLAVIAFTINIPMFFNRRMTERIFSIYELIGLIMVYYIPLIITFVLTVLVICELNRNRGTLGVSYESTGARQGERNITRTMVITVMAYILLVLPLILSITFERLFKFNLPKILLFTFVLLIGINYSVNIFIYTLYLPKFRSTLFGIFKCKCCKKVPDESVRITTEPSTSGQMRQLLPYNLVS